MELVPLQSFHLLARKRKMLLLNKFQRFLQKPTILILMYISVLIWGQLS